MATVAGKEPPKERLSIYLVKENVAKVAYSALIKTESAQPAIEVVIDNTVATLFIRPPSFSLPAWTRIFTALPNVPEESFGLASTVGAVLIYPGERTFLVSFGTGHYLINDESMERDFGLRVTLNSVDPKRLRSLDKASQDPNPLNSRTQSSRDVDAFDLQMNAESDMLSALTGASKVEAFGSHVTGRDALHLSVPITAARLPALLSLALQQYSKKLAPEFEWVENISRVRDSSQIVDLNARLDDALTNDPQAIAWLGEPEIVDWEKHNGYSFDCLSKTPRHAVLELDGLKKYLADKSRALTVDELKNTTVHVNDRAYKSFHHWSAYRCLYAELPVGDKNYILRNGDWFVVQSDFVSVINKSVARVKTCDIDFPVYKHDNEKDYSKEASESDKSFVLMDRKNIQLGGRYSKIEFCDLLKDGKKLIHIKPYSGSSTLSHLFAQGSVASEALISDEAFRKALYKKLPDAAGFKKPSKRPEASDFTVIFAIATNKRVPEELPFFSKVTLRNAFSRLSALNFSVQLAAIPLDPTWAKMQKIKPHKKAAALR